MRLRPHHVLDIVTQYGRGLPFRPSPYGHAVHTTAEALLADPDISIEFVVDADDICAPCKHLIGSRCNDMLTHCDPPLSKQAYNDDLDRRVLAYFNMVEGDVLTFREYLAVIRTHLDGLEAVCTHPREDPAERLAGLIAGLERLGA
ncbi:MAG: DUF1284 domain-containing protein [Candidatus Zipacnadales bacterium]